MPAAAVIPAPIAYIKVVAVKKLVVGFLSRKCGLHYVHVSATVLASGSVLHVASLRCWYASLLL